MSQLAKQLPNRVIALEVRFYACVARLRERTDEEALHDLRITLRTLRSVLRPLRNRAVVAVLEQAAAAVGRISGPVRDAQVLLAELQRLGLNSRLISRQSSIDTAIEQLLASAELTQLCNAFADFTRHWRQSVRTAEQRHLRATLSRALHKDKRRLQTLLDEPVIDWHRVRVWVKRLRYADASYLQLDVLTYNERRLLRRLQATLGDWHDRLQWLASSGQDAALLGCRAGWQAQAETALQTSETLLLRMRALGDRSVKP